MRWQPFYLVLRSHAQELLVGAALSILVLNSLIALLFQETVLTFELADYAWAPIYTIVLVWALIHATVNALLNGVAKMPLFMMPNAEKDQNIDNNFCMVALVSLVFIPIVAVPVLMSVNVLLTN